MVGKNILIVDDEAPIREMIAVALEMAGYECLEAENTQQAHAIIVDRKPDLILLDWMLPGTSGIELARRLKRDELTGDIPIIMLTAKGEEDNKIQGLEVGADDYITKPFSPRELVARVRAVLRRCAPAEPATRFVHDAEAKRIDFRGQRLDLTRYEYGLLAALLRRPGAILSRDQLLDLVHGRAVLGGVEAEAEARLHLPADAGDLVETDLVDLFGGEVGCRRGGEAVGVIGLAVRQRADAGRHLGGIGLVGGHEVHQPVVTRLVAALERGLELAAHRIAFGRCDRPGFDKLGDLGLAVLPDGIVRAAVERSAGLQLRRLGDHEVVGEIGRAHPIRRARLGNVDQLPDGPADTADARDVIAHVLRRIDPVLRDQRRGQEHVDALHLREHVAAVAPLGGLRRLLDAIEAPRVVFVSSTAVYGQDAGEWVDEASPAQPTAFNGRVLLTDIVAPTSYQLQFDAQGGVAGFGKGSSRVELKPAGSGCELHYTVNSTVGGKIAQLGQRLIDGAAKSLAEDFFRRFEEELQARHPAAATASPATAATPTAASGGLPGWAWAAIAAAVVLGLVLLT